MANPSWVFEFKTLKSKDHHHGWVFKQPPFISACNCVEFKEWPCIPRFGVLFHRWVQLEEHWHGKAEANHHQRVIFADVCIQAEPTWSSMSWEPGYIVDSHKILIGAGQTNLPLIDIRVRGNKGVLSKHCINRLLS